MWVAQTRSIPKLCRSNQRTYSPEIHNNAPELSISPCAMSPTFDRPSDAALASRGRIATLGKPISG